MCFLSDGGVADEWLLALCGTEPNVFQDGELCLASSNQAWHLPFLCSSVSFLWEILLFLYWVYLCCVNVMRTQLMLSLKLPQSLCCPSSCILYFLISVSFFPIFSLLLWFRYFHAFVFNHVWYSWSGRFQCRPIWSNQSMTGWERLHNFHKIDSQVTNQ